MLVTRGQRRLAHKIWVMNSLLIVAISASILLHGVNGEETERSGTIVTGSVDMNDELIRVLPEPSNFTEVRITGVLNSDIKWSPNTEYVMGYFHTDLTEWNYTIPDPMNLKSPTPKPFSFTVQVPFNASGATNRTISIWASWIEYPNKERGNFSSDEVKIYIEPYFNLKLQYNDHIRIKAGETGKVYLNVTNYGNIGDAPDIHILNNAELKERGWDLSLSLNKCKFPSGSHQKHPLIIKVPVNERSGIYEIEIELISRTGKHVGAEPFGNYSINVEVDGKLYYDIGPNYVATGSLLSLLLIISLGVVLVMMRKRRRRLT